MAKSKKCHVGTKVQTLIFSKDHFTEAQAKEWAKEHDFNYGYIDEKENTYRIRQEEPDDFEEGSMRTITIKEGVQSVIGCPKKDKMKKGGHIGFDKLAHKIAKEYEGKSVPAEYQDKYGKTYSKEAALEVGRETASKVYREQQVMAKGGKVGQNTEYYILKYPNNGAPVTIHSTKEFDKEAIQKIFDENVEKLEVGEILEYGKQDDYEFTPDILTVEMTKNGLKRYTPSGALRDYKIKTTMAKGGKVKSISYDSGISEIIKDQVTDAFDNLRVHYELNVDKVEENEYKVYPGFVPFTDGGWTASGRSDVSYFSSTGKNMPTPDLKKVLEVQIKGAYKDAKDQFNEEHPELLEELGEDKINYSDLEEAGYSSEAEELSELENDYMGGDESEILFELQVKYYNPENGHNDFEGKHSCVVSTSVDFEAPYFSGQSAWSDYQEESFSFDSEEELKEKLHKHLENALDWFGVNNKFACGGMMAEGGAVGSFADYYATHGLMFGSLFGGVKMAEGGDVGVKKYYIQNGIGKAKYTISSYNGVDTHNDGSPFYGIEIFKNKKDLEVAEKKLLKEGYVERYAEGGGVDKLTEIEFFHKGKKEKAKAYRDGDAFWVIATGKHKGTTIHVNVTNIGGIKNQYEGKTSKEVWNEWTPAQRLHFMMDHFTLSSGKMKHGYGKTNFEDLPATIQIEVDIHLMEGQYAEGGGVADRRLKSNDLVYVDGKNLYGRILGIARRTNGDHIDYQVHFYDPERFAVVSEDRVTKVGHVSWMNDRIMGQLPIVDSFPLYADFTVYHASDKEGTSIFWLVDKTDADKLEKAGWKVTSVFVKKGQYPYSLTNGEIGVRDRYAEGGDVKVFDWHGFTIKELEKHLKSVGGDISFYVSKGVTTGNDMTWHKLPEKEIAGKKFSLGQHGKDMEVRSGAENMYLALVAYDDNYKAFTINVYTKENKAGLKSIANRIVNLYANGGVMAEGGGVDPDAWMVKHVANMVKDMNLVKEHKGDRIYEEGDPSNVMEHSILVVSPDNSVFVMGLDQRNRSIPVTVEDAVDHIDWKYRNKK